MRYVRCALCKALCKVLCKALCRVGYVWCSSTLEVGPARSCPDEWMAGKGGGREGGGGGGEGEKDLLTIHIGNGHLNHRFENTCALCAQMPPWEASVNWFTSSGSVHNVRFGSCGSHEAMLFHGSA